MRAGYEYRIKIDGKYLVFCPPPFFAPYTEHVSPSGQKYYLSDYDEQPFSPDSQEIARRLMAHMGVEKYEVVLE